MSCPKVFSNTIQKAYCVQEMPFRQDHNHSVPELEEILLLAAPVWSSLNYYAKMVIYQTILHNF
ncbi:hypothetical protein XIS1_450028 [Xenorhabdus innexi]|uniref:Uncharacterized protein n=1 Tax=Xenorhabdus innexi TaxID=290109 RepID=A0A1N6MY14_9GAMM|nr:hypothetical protein XIS1_450028 [Xenorhabdus innexi]